MGILVTTNSEVERGLVRPLPQRGAIPATPPPSLLGTLQAKVPPKFPRGFKSLGRSSQNILKSKRRCFFQPNNWNSENSISLLQETGRLTQSSSEEEPHPAQLSPKSGSPSSANAECTRSSAGGKIEWLETGPWGCADLGVQTQFPHL